MEEQQYIVVVDDQLPWHAEFVPACSALEEHRGVMLVNEFRSPSDTDPLEMGALQRTGKVGVGDRLLKVHEKDLASVAFEQAFEVLKEAAADANEIPVVLEFQVRAAARSFCQRVCHCRGDA